MPAVDTKEREREREKCVPSSKVHVGYEIRSCMNELKACCRALYSFTKFIAESRILQWQTTCSTPG